jgi:hypothetical protein
MTFSQGHALLVGVSSYTHEPRLNVPVASRDAKAIRDVLLDRQYCGYREEQVITLYEDRANREHILDALDRLASRVKKDSTVFIFFCGHGDYGTDGNYYLLCNDSRVEGNKVSSGTGICQQEFLLKLRAIEAQRVVVVLNSCHSGEISPSLSIKETFGGKVLPNETAEALMATGSGRILITACREGQLSWIGGRNLSIFSQALFDALEGKDITPLGGFVSVFDLYTSLYQNVSSQVGDLLGVEQEPELTVLKGVGPFAVALYQGASQTNLGAVDEMVELPQEGVVRQVEAEKSNLAYQKILHQSGRINIGEHNRIDIHGNMTGGDETNTSGGAYVRGNVKVQGGDFVGRDNKIQNTGVYAERDLIAENVAGRDLINQGGRQANPELEELTRLLRELMIHVAQSHLDDEMKDVVKEDLKTIEKEALKSQPNKATLRSRLNGIQGILQEATAAGTVVVGFVELIQKIQGLISQIIR